MLLSRPKQTLNGCLCIRRLFTGTNFLKKKINMVSLPNWFPKPLSKASGMEVARLSFLGPMFAWSVFAEDNTKVVEKHFACLSHQLTPDDVSLVYQSLQHRMQYHRICVEGNIGSGKTTFLEYFRRFERLVEINEEPVQKWREFKGHKPLATLYEDPTRWAFTFQTFVLTTLKETHAKPQTKRLRLMERSLYSAMYCFIENQLKSGHLTNIEYAILTEMFDYLAQDNHLNMDLIVYLKTSPETCYKRILNRQRQEETGISMAYLEGLHNLHEDWLIKGNTKKIVPPVLVIDGNQDKVKMESEFKSLLSQLTLKSS